MQNAVVCLISFLEAIQCTHIEFLKVFKEILTKQFDAVGSMSDS